MRPIIGFNYGAREYKRVSKIYMLVMYMCCGIMAVGTVICMAAPQSLIGLFTDNPDTVEMGKTALRLISIGFIPSAVSVTSSGALEGLGKGVQSLAISMCRYLIIIVPVAFLLCKIIGPTGAWHAFWIAELLTAAVSVIIYKKSTAIKQA